MARWTTPQQTKQTDESNVSVLRTHCTARRLDAAADPEIFDPVDTRCGKSSGLVLEETGVKNNQCCTKTTHLQELLFSGRKERRHIFSLMWHFGILEWAFYSFKELRGHAHMNRNINCHSNLHIK